MAKEGNPEETEAMTSEVDSSAPRVSVQPSTPAKRPTSGLYENSKEASKAVREEFNHWTGKLTESSFQLSLAVIAANWAVFANKDNILNNLWARASIAIVLLSLAVSLIAAKIMGEAHRKIIERSESDTIKWESEFDATLNTQDPWPFTDSIIRNGRFFRECKTWLPLAGGFLFLIAICGG